MFYISVSGHITLHSMFDENTSMVLINFSVSASSSHLHSSSLSGLVATTLLGPIAASEMSLLVKSVRFNKKLELEV